MIDLPRLVSINRPCPGCAGKGWIRGTWTGGDLLNRATVPAYGLCPHCDATGFVPERDQPITTRNEEGPRCDERSPSLTDRMHP